MLEEIIILTDDDSPGMLAAIGELLGGAGVNIETLAASTRIGQGVIHLVVDDGDDVVEILRSNDYKVEASRPVMAATIDDKPGEFGRFCRKLSNAGIDISACYVARRSGGETEFIFAVDDLEAAKQA